MLLEAFRACRPCHVRLHERDRWLREVPHGRARPCGRKKELPAEQPHGPVRSHSVWDTVPIVKGGRCTCSRTRWKAVGRRRWVEPRPSDVRRIRQVHLPQGHGCVRRQLPGDGAARRPVRGWRRRRVRRRGVAAGVHLHRAALHAHPRHAFPSHAALPGAGRRPVPAVAGWRHGGGAGAGGGVGELLLRAQRPRRHAGDGLRQHRRARERHVT